MSKHDMILELQRLIQDLQHDEVEATPEAILDTLEARLVPDTAGQDVKVHTINAVECDSLMDAVEALCEAGVVQIEVHPAFWEQWHAMFLRAYPLLKWNMLPVLPMYVDIEEEKDQGRFLINTLPFLDCGTEDCPVHSGLFKQWEHRLPEDVKKTIKERQRNRPHPNPNNDPTLN